MGRSERRRLRPSATGRWSGSKGSVSMAPFPSEGESPTFTAYVSVGAVQHDPGWRRPNGRRPSGIFTCWSRWASVRIDLADRRRSHGLDHVRARTVLHRSSSFAARTVAAAICFLAVRCSALWSSDPVQATRRPTVRRSYGLAPGVHLITIRDRGTPNEVRVIRVNHGAAPAPALEVLTASEHYPGYRQPSLLGSDAGSVAAINGDFVASDGRPKHRSMVDGEVWTSGIQRGPVFAVSADGHRAFIGRPHLEVTARSAGTTFAIGSWNAGDPGGSKWPASPGEAARSNRPREIDRPKPGIHGTAPRGSSLPQEHVVSPTRPPGGRRTWSRSSPNPVSRPGLGVPQP